MNNVQIHSETKHKLNDLKIHPENTYDDEPLTNDELRSIKANEEDIKFGRIRSLRDIMNDLGDDQVIQTTDK